MKKMFWNETDETLEKRGRKIETKNTNKFKEYEIMKQEIEDETEREREELRIEKKIKN